MDELDYNVSEQNDIVQWRKISRLENRSPENLSPEDSLQKISRNLIAHPNEKAR